MSMILPKCNHLLDYVAWYPNATICIHTSNMILNIDPDVAYLVLPRAYSRLTIHFSLSSKPAPNWLVLPNRPILIEYKTIWHVITSAAEAETADLFHDATTARTIWHISQELGHLQLPTLPKTAYTTANTTANRTANTFTHQLWDTKNLNCWICSTGDRMKILSNQNLKYSGTKLLTIG